MDPKIVALEVAINRTAYGHKDKHGKTHTSGKTLGDAAKTITCDKGRGTDDTVCVTIFSPIMGEGECVGSGPMATESPRDKTLACLVTGKGISAAPAKKTEGKLKRQNLKGTRRQRKTLVPPT